MKRIMKKGLTILLTIQMIISLIPVAFAVESTAYSLQGDAVVFAPPSGSFSKIPYKLIDSSTEEAITGAVFSISGDAPDGVTLNKDKNALIIDGSKIEEGSFTLSATYNGETLSKEISVFDGRMSFDFEGQETGTAGTAQAKKLSDNTLIETELLKNYAGDYAGKIGEEENGNKYYASDGWGPRMELKPAGITQWQNVRFATAAFDVKKSKYNSNVTIAQESKTGLAIKWESGTNKLMCGTNVCDFVLSQTEWKRIYILFDFYTEKYTVYAGENTFGPFDMAVNASYKYIHTLTFQNAVDNVTFFSGIPTNAAFEENMSVPASIEIGTNGVKMPISDSIIVDNTEIKNTITWETDADGVVIEDGYITISDTAQRGNISITANASGMSKVFNIILEDAIESNTQTQGATVDVSSLGEISVIKAVFSGENAVLEGFDEDLLLPSDENSSLHIYIDDFKKEYIVICNNKTFSYGEYTSLSDVTIDGAQVDFFYAGSPYDEAPMALDVRFSANPVVGQTISVDYTYFSKLYEKTGDSVTWHLEGEAPKISSNFSIDDEMVGKTLSASVSVSGGGKTSDTVFTDTETIRDVYDVSKTGDKTIRVDILSIDADNFIVAVEWIKNGERAGTTAKKVSIDDSPYTFTAGENIDDARVWLMNSDLTPIAAEKLASGNTVTYQSSGKTQTGITYENGNLYVYDETGKMTSIVVYKPQAEADFAQYHNSFVPSGSFETPWDNKVCYMGVISPDAKIPLDTEVSGIYLAKAITQSGEIQTEFIVGNDKLFTENKLQSLLKPQFTNIMRLTGAADSDTVGNSMYDNFQKAQASTVNTIMQGEGYDMAELNTAILLSAFLKDKGNKEALVTNLSSRTLPTVGVELIIKNHDFAKSAALVTLNGGIEKALESIFETAVLEGVANSGNYLETKEYLNKIDGYNVSDDMALAFTPSSENSHVYPTLADLKSAMDSYNGSSNDNGGNDGSNDNGNIGGTTGNSGFVGGGGSGGGGYKKPAEENKNETVNAVAFSDVPTNHWASSDIAYLVENKIINGMGDGSFAPDKNITRAEFLKILAVAFPITSSTDAIAFEDVNSGDWYYEYVKKASEAGVITGDGKSFSPNNPISRQDAAVMLYRVLSNLNVAVEGGENTATDSGDISSYAIKAVNALYNAGIINGMEDGSFMPKSDITRAQAAAIVARVLR